MRPSINERVVVEAMTEADIDAVLAIDLASFPAIDLAQGKDVRAARTAQLREELARSWAHLYVARVNGEIVGYVLFWHVVDEIHLLNVAVAPAWRRRGFGAALVGGVRVYAHQNRVAKILLEVRASNRPAIALYERYGFWKFNTRVRYYSDGEDAVEMMLAFN